MNFNGIYRQLNLIWILIKMEIIFKAGIPLIRDYALQVLYRPLGCLVTKQFEVFKTNLIPTKANLKLLNLKWTTFHFRRIILNRNSQSIHASLTDVGTKRLWGTKIFDFGTHRTWTSTMSVKKSVKMYLVARLLSVKQVLVASFWYFFFFFFFLLINYTPDEKLYKM